MSEEKPVTRKPVKKPAVKPAAKPAVKQEPLVASAESAKSTQATKKPEDVALRMLKDAWKKIGISGKVIAVLVVLGILGKLFNYF